MLGGGVSSLVPGDVAIEVTAVGVFPGWRGCSGVRIMMYSVSVGPAGVT